MKQNNTAVIDFGSSKITVFVGSETSDGSFVVKAIGEAKYDGFCDGEWLVVDGLYNAVSTAIKKAESVFKNKIGEVYVGVPGEFVTVVTANATAFLSQKRRKVTQRDVEHLFQTGNKEITVKDSKLISRSPIYYDLDDQERLIDPVGASCSKLSGLMSYAYANENFTATISTVLSSLGVNKTEFISSNLAQAIFYVDAQERDRTAVIVDIGYISSSVMVSRGDGILLLKSFSLGGGHISADLSQVLDLSFADAERLKTKINLNLDMDGESTYNINNAIRPNANVSNAVVKARIEDFAEYIANCMQECMFEIPQSANYYITGGGLTYVKGASEYLGYLLGKQFSLLTCALPQANKNEYTSAYGLLSLALNYETSNKKGFFKNLSAIFGGKI